MQYYIITLWFLKSIMRRQLYTLRLFILSKESYVTKLSSKILYIRSKLNYFKS